MLSLSACIALFIGVSAMVATVVANRIMRFIKFRRLVFQEVSNA